MTAIQCLVEEGHLDPTKAGQATLHRSVRAYREADDTPVAGDDEEEI